MNANQSSNKLKVAILVNVLVVVFEVWAISFGIGRHGVAGNFIYYTECSNLFGTVACAVCAIAEIRQLRGGKECSQIVRWLKYAASCCLLMTLFVVVFVLTPMLYSINQPGFYLMFIDGAKSVTHFGAPIAVTASYVLFEADRAMTLKQSLVGFAPTLLYAAVAYPCNILRVWDGPYPFFQVWTMPVWMSVLWFVVLFVLAFALCQIPRVLARKRSHLNPL